MVHVHPVRDFVRDHPAAHVGRGKHQPPIVADRARRRTASPARRGIADADRSNHDPRTARSLGGLGGQQVACVALEPCLDPPGKAVAWPAADQPLALQPGRSRPVGLPLKHDLDPFDRNDFARLERAFRRKLGKLRLDPGALADCPVERGLAAGAWRAGQQQLALAGIEPEAQSAGLGMMTDLDRPG